MGRLPLPIGAVRLLPLLALAAAAAGCGTGNHLRRLDALHDPKDFAHRPDLPKTWEACLREIRALSGASRAEPRDAAATAYLLARVTTQDSAALHRAEACRALGPLGAALAPDGESPAGPPATEAEAAAALQGLREADEVDGRAALFARVAEFRIPLVGDPGPAGFGRDLRILREMLAGVMAASRGEPEAVEAMRSLGFQVVRTAVAGSILHDGDLRVRVEAAAAASTFGGADMAEILRTAYATEPDGGPRRAVVGASAALAARLPNRHRITAITVLLAALDDDDRGIRFEAREGLKSLAGEDLGGQPAPWMRWWDAERDRP